MVSKSFFAPQDARKEQYTSDVRDDFADLQTASLTVVALTTMAVAYTPFTLWPFIKTSVPTSFWIGMAFLGLSALVSYLLRSHHLWVAQHALAWGISGATIINVISFESPAVSFFLVLPVIFASVLLSQRAVFLIALMNGLFILTQNPPSEGTHFPLVETVLPLGMIALAAIASSLSVRNLHTALAWYQQGLRACPFQ
jgi:hypothetical protein